MPDSPLLAGLEQTVSRALEEDIGTGDITAELIPPEQTARARVICRESAVICGRPWVDDVFRQLNPALQPQWHVEEGDVCQPNDVIFSVEGPARTLLTAERCALNFLQSLSGTATIAHHYASLIRGTHFRNKEENNKGDTHLRILDTRKTIPGLRLAQKYAVLTGGCHNHRLGLYDAFLIKENHIAAKGGIRQVIQAARALHPDRPVEIEVENLEQLQEALTAEADIIMLDNFSLDQLRQAVAINDGRAKLEASGGYDDNAIVDVAATGVDYISVGALTKHCRAIDFSMRLD